VKFVDGDEQAKKTRSDKGSLIFLCMIPPRIAITRSWVLACTSGLARTEIGRWVDHLRPAA